MVDTLEMFALLHRLERSPNEQQAGSREADTVFKQKLQRCALTEGHEIIHFLSALDSLFFFFQVLGL